MNVDYFQQYDNGDTIKEKAILDVETGEVTPLFADAKAAFASIDPCASLCREYIIVNGATIDLVPSFVEYRVSKVSLDDVLNGDALLSLGQSSLDQTM